MQVVKGAAGLVGDAITFKWATTTIGQAAVNAVVVTEVRVDISWYFCYVDHSLVYRLPAGSLLVNVLARGLWLVTKSETFSGPL